jgi:uncharacterized membrane protein YccC
MAQFVRWLEAGLNRRALIHSARTAVAAILSFYAARLIAMPEAYWATVSALVVMQSTWGAAVAVSGKRFAGTAIGCAIGGALSTRFGPNMLVFGIAVFGIGLICATFHLDRVAYRYAGITLTVVMLVVRTKPAWVIAGHRFVEVSVGITVGLLLTAVWPEGDSLNLPPQQVGS